MNKESKDLVKEEKMMKVKTKAKSEVEVIREALGFAVEI